MLANAMKSYPGAEALNAMHYALEGLELFGSAKQKLDLPPSADCDSHQSDKVNYYIPHPNTRAKRSFIQALLNSVEHDVAHTTSMFVTDCVSSHWHTTQFNSAKDLGRCKHRLCAMPKSEDGKHGTAAPTYKGLKEYHSTNNVEYEFGSALMASSDISMATRRSMYWTSL